MLSRSLPPIVIPWLSHSPNFAFLLTLALPPFLDIPVTLSQFHALAVAHSSLWLTRTLVPPCHIDSVANSNCLPISFVLRSRSRFAQILCFSPLLITIVLDLLSPAPLGLNSKAHSLDCSLHTVTLFVLVTSTRIPMPGTLGIMTRLVLT